MFSSKILYFVKFKKIKKHFESREMNYKYDSKTVLCENEKPQIPTLY